MANWYGNILAALLLVAHSGPVSPGPFEDGHIAANRGDHATALQLV